MQILIKVCSRPGFFPDFSYNATSKGLFNIRYISIADSVTKAVSKYCELNNTTPYMLFMALFHTCIFMHSGVSQTVTTSPIFDRTTHESQQAIGFFLNGLLVKSSINKEMSLDDIIQQVRQFVYEAMKNSDIHVTLLVDSIGEKMRDALFNVVFNYMNIDDEDDKLFTDLGQGASIL